MQAICHFPQNPGPDAVLTTWAGRMGKSRKCGNCNKYRERTRNRKSTDSAELLTTTMLPGTHDIRSLFHANLTARHESVQPINHPPSDSECARVRLHQISPNRMFAWPGQLGTNNTNNTTPKLLKHRRRCRRHRRRRHRRRRRLINTATNVSALLRTGTPADRRDNIFGFAPVVPRCGGTAACFICETKRAREDNALSYTNNDIWCARNERMLRYTMRYVRRTLCARAHSSPREALAAHKWRRARGRNVCE